MKPHVTLQTLRRLLIVTIFLLASVAAFVWRAPLLTSYARWFDVGEEPTQVDYCYILPGDFDTRPFVAAALYRAGLTPKIVLPQTQSTPDERENRVIPHHEMLRRVLVHQGVPGADIVIIPEGSLSTFDDALALASWLPTKSRTSVAIVTNDYHTRRARWIFRRVLADHDCELHMVSAPMDFYRAENWWRDVDGLLSYVGEPIKFALYQLRYGHGALWLLGSVLAMAASWFALRRRLAGRPSTVP